MRISAVDAINLDGASTHAGVHYQIPTHIRVTFDLSHAECDFLNWVEGHSHLGVRLQEQLGDLATIVSRRNIGLKLQLKWNPRTETLSEAVGRAEEFAKTALADLRRKAAAAAVVEATPQD